jgi:hypothetical protein
LLEWSVVIEDMRGKIFLNPRIYWKWKHERLLQWKL